MKTKNKIIILTIVMIIIVGTLLSNVSLAASMTKDALEKNIKAYNDGTKRATGTVDNGTVTIGESGGTVTVDDSTIKLESEGATFVVNYTLSDSEATFSMVQEYNRMLSDTSLLLRNVPAEGQ